MMMGFLLLIASRQVFASADLSTNQNYPFHSFGAATISSVVFSAKSSHPQIIKTENKDRDNTSTMEGKAHLQSLYWQGLPGKPFVFLMPGVGGASDDGNSEQPIFLAIRFDSHS
jgi:hypothetical protein